MKKAMLAIVGGLLLFVVAAPDARAVCENIADKTIIFSIAWFRTLNGNDQSWVNDFYDSGSAQPSFQQFTEVGYLPAGATWNAGFINSIQDSGNVDCDDVTIKNFVDWWDNNTFCVGVPNGGMEIDMHKNTCMLPGGGAAKYYSQRTILVGPIEQRLSYSGFTHVCRAGFSCNIEDAYLPCVRVSTLATGCNN